MRRAQHICSLTSQLPILPEFLNYCQLKLCIFFIIVRVSSFCWEQISFFLEQVGCDLIAAYLSLRWRLHARLGTIPALFVFFLPRQFFIKYTAKGQVDLHHGQSDCQLHWTFASSLSFRINLGVSTSITCWAFCFRLIGARGHAPRFTAHNVVCEHCSSTLSFMCVCVPVTLKHRVF